MSSILDAQAGANPAPDPGSGLTSDNTMRAVRRGVATGAMFVVLVRMSFRLLGLVNTLILVRLLVPGDFGLVGLVTAAYGILDLLSQMSLQLAIIRMPTPTRADYDTAWTLGVLRGGLIAGLLVLSAPLLASYIHEPRMIQLTYVLACVSVVQGFENIRLVDLQREFRYDRIFVYQVAGKVAGVLTAIPLAFLFHNYWALMCGIAATRLTMIVMGYVMRPYRPRVSFASWRELFHFSKWLMVGNVLWVIDANAMTFVIGRISGPSAIGMYQVGNQIGGLPASEIAAPVRDPIYAGSARLIGDIAQLRRYFLENLEILVAIIVPLSLAICLLARPIAVIFLGHRWIATIPLIRWCALYALFDAIGHYPGGVYTVLNRQKDFSIILAFALMVRVPAIIFGGIYAGVEGAAMALACSAVLNTALWNAFIPRELSLRLNDFVRHTWRTIIASAAMVSAVGGLLVLYPEPHSTALQLLRFLAISAAGATVQLMAQFTTWALAGYPLGAERTALNAAAALFSRLARPAPTSNQMG